MSDFSEQLSDYCARLAGEVAQRILEMNVRSDPDRKRLIEDFVVNSLPDLITNSVLKTSSLHSNEGLNYAEQNFEKMVQTYTQSLLGKI